MTNPTPHGQVPEALRIADEFKLCNEYDSIPSMNDIAKAEAELRRLHAENTTLQQGYDAARMEIDGLRDRVQELGAMLRENRSKRIVELEAQLESIGAGGVEPLRRRECLHQIAEPADLWTIRTEANEGESPWCGLYALRADAERDAVAMNKITGRHWELVPLVVATQTAPSAGDWINVREVQSLVRELDVALNGEHGAAPQASLCDVVGQVKAEADKLGRPVLAAPAAVAGPSADEILALNAGEIHFSESPSKYQWAVHGTQYHAGAPGVLSFARAVLARWGAAPTTKATPAAVQCVECNSCGSAFDIDTYMAGYTDGKGHCLNCPGIDHAAPLEAPAAHGDALDAAFEAVRHRLCGMQRYSFVLDDDGVVRRVEDRTGRWIEFDDAHELFDPVAVDAARSQAKEGANHD